MHEPRMPSYHVRFLSLLAWQESEHVVTNRFNHRLKDSPYKLARCSIILSPGTLNEISHCVDSKPVLSSPALQQ